MRVCVSKYSVRVLIKYRTVSVAGLGQLAWVYDIQGVLLFPGRDNLFLSLVYIFVCFVSFFVRFVFVCLLLFFCFFLLLFFCFWGRAIYSSE